MEKFPYSPKFLPSAHKISGLSNYVHPGIRYHTLLIDLLRSVIVYIHSLGSSFLLANISLFEIDGKYNKYVAFTAPTNKIIQYI